MRSHQQKFLADVEAIAKSNGMEIAHDPTYGNTGWVTISFEGEYEPVVRFYYAFDSGNNAEPPRINIDGIPNPKRAALMRNGKPDEGPQGRNWWLLHPDELTQILGAIRQMTAKAVNEARAAELASLTK